MYIIGMLIVQWIILRLLIIERVPYKLDETIHCGKYISYTL
jgi:hypothetical protein